MTDKETRDRVRALVREVLATATTEGETDAAHADNAGGSITNDGVVNNSSAGSGGAFPTSSINLPTAASSAPDMVEEFTRDESAKTIITEADVRDLESGARLRIGEGTRLTPLAADIVRERGIEIVRRAARRTSSRAKIIAVGADHGGFEMKEDLHRFLTAAGYQVRDFGTHSTEAVDYPDIAHAVARAVAEHEADLGIMIDGAGVGSAMTANKVPGVRAAACYSVAVAKNSREHNDANVLTLGSKTITTEEMREIVKAWLATEINEDRHRKRVAKIEVVERQYRR